MQKTIRKYQRGQGSGKSDKELAPMTVNIGIRTMRCLFFFVKMNGLLIPLSMK
ncbi:hypothetical protein [Bacillus sp. 7884-1]|uniref:hypothetical protein n=1 Tax=Bacillus sp. 7884-1 TaxID=2021693 RepID=UPI0015CAF348|nr:hypothetical protein [Bacillus sp. 7884-1]